MNGYSAVKIFDDRARDLFARATRIVRMFPDREDAEKSNSWIRCHEVARAVAHVLDLNLEQHVVDGKFGPCDHSWIELGTTREGDLIILDTYAIAQLPCVQLVHVTRLLPSLYRNEEPRDDIRHDVTRYLIDLAIRYEAPTCIRKTGTDG